MAEMEKKFLALKDSGVHKYWVASGKVDFVMKSNNRLLRFWIKPVLNMNTSKTKADILGQLENLFEHVCSHAPLKQQNHPIFQPLNRSSIRIALFRF
jgi:hypothetical protein